MKIYFVRHGHPNYEQDCLTKMGHEQAKACAERLKNVEFDDIFSSSKGRALQTAQYTADLLHLSVIPCDFMREIGWRSLDGEPILENGHPWKVADAHVAEGKSLLDPEWREKYPYCQSHVVQRTENVVQGFDRWLEELGYKREGEHYRVISENTDKTVAMFSHAGSSSAALAHMMNIPFPLFCGTFAMNFTSITVVELPNALGQLVCPKITLLGDANHIEDISEENFFGN